jgi:hypothetical protein
MEIDIKQISGYRKYFITNTGVVINKDTNRVLRQEISRGYLRVTLSEYNCQKRFLVHRLVAKHFLLKTIDKNVVNHIDGNKLNNSVENLEWCTASENELHSYKVLGKVNSNRKLNNHAIIDILLNAKKGINHTNKGNIQFYIDKYGVARKTILNVLNRKYYVNS